MDDSEPSTDLHHDGRTSFLTSLSARDTNHRSSTSAPVLDLSSTSSQPLHLSCPAFPHPSRLHAPLHTDSCGASSIAAPFLLHDFFQCHLPHVHNSLSDSAPICGLDDDFCPQHMTASGAWYPHARGLASFIGRALYADQVAICAQLHQEALLHTRLVPTTCGDVDGSGESTSTAQQRVVIPRHHRSHVAPKCRYAIHEIPTRESWDPAEIAHNGFNSQKSVDYEFAMADNDDDDDSDSDDDDDNEDIDDSDDEAEWAGEGDGCDTLLWRRQIMMEYRNIRTRQNHGTGITTSHGDITPQQVANGTDVQGIPWENLPLSREDYRESRMRESIRKDSAEDKESLHGILKDPRSGARFYDFLQNTRRVKCSISHFQLRNLAWATSKHDVFVMHDAAVVHWDATEGRSSQVLDLSGSKTSLASGLEQVQISTMIAMGDLIIAGGLFGELIAKNLSTGTIIHNEQITYDESAITNAIDMFENTVMASNNDCYVRCFDIQTFQKKASFQFGMPVNHATRQPNGGMIAVAGDRNSVQVIDGDNGARIAQLHGHEDFCFATGWHPNGRMFATGSQDKTCRVWDVRNMSQSFTVLGANSGAVRSLRFSSCGEFLMMAEPRDFIHILDINRGEFDSCQEVDLFGEIAGIALTPYAESLFVAVSDPTYSSLIEYERRAVKSPNEMII